MGLTLDVFLIDFLNVEGMLPRWFGLHAILILLWLT